MSRAIISGPDSNWGRALAYHPLLAHFFGSINAGILFGQIAYWQERTENPLGVFKTVEEWTEETGLSYREQATARSKLAGAGYMTETNLRSEHRMFFRIEWDAFNPDFRAWIEARGGVYAAPTKTQVPPTKTQVPPTKAQQAPTKTQFVNKEESTQESTYKKAPAGVTTGKPSKPAALSAQDLIADGLTEQTAHEFIAHRKSKRAALTPRAWDGIKTEAAKAGWPIEDAVCKCLTRGWTGFEASWVAGERGAAAMTPARGTGETAYQRSMREKYEQVCPAVAAKPPRADGAAPVPAFLEVIDVTPRRLG